MKIGLITPSPLGGAHLQRALETERAYRVVWVATDAVMAAAQCSTDKPDVVLLDPDVPGDVEELVRLVTARAGCPILVVSANLEGRLSLVYRLIGLGAAGAFPAPTAAEPVGSAQALLDKLASLYRLVSRPSISRPRMAAIPSLPPMLAIGSSTGGPKALLELFMALPADHGAAIVVVQHVDPGFAPGLATWIGSQVSFPVRVAAEGDTPQPGVALVAATGDHLVVRRDHALGYVAEPRELPYRPSVDVFFRSLVDHWPRPGVAALLTGMGRDGADGLLALRHARWHTIAQDEATSTIYGMPKAAAACGAAMEVLPLPRIAEAAVRRLR